MYPYHQRIKQRIDNNELTGFEFVESYNHIKEKCLLLYFKTEPMVRPIRQHKFNQYESIWNVEKKEKMQEQ